MRHDVFISIVLIIGLLQLVESHSKNGTSHLTCRELRPGHGIARNGKSSFVIEVTNDNSKQLQVSLTSTNDSTFIGFILQAREVGKDRPIGKFTHLSTGVQVVKCDNESVSMPHNIAVL